MALSPSPEELIRLALVAGAVLLAVSLWLISLLVLFRALRLRRERRRRRVTKVWKPLILQALTGGETRPSRLRPSDETTVLFLWNYYRESLRGESTAPLDALARAARLDAVALRRLRRGSVRERMLAIGTLGHLKVADAWGELLSVGKGDNGFLALAACRALVDIDPEQALPTVVPLLSARGDWSPARFAAILGEADPDVLGRVIVEAVTSASPPTARGLLRFLESVDPDTALPILRQAMRAAQRPEVIAACLHGLAHFRRPGDAEAPRGHLGHPSSVVRSQAAASLGRFADAADEPRLVRLLADPDWWVRYRAAQALTQLPGVGVDRLRRIRAELADPRAKEAVGIVIAERKMLVPPLAGREGD